MLHKKWRKLETMLTQRRSYGGHDQEMQTLWVGLLAVHQSLCLYQLNFSIFLTVSTDVVEYCSLY